MGWWEKIWRQRAENWIYAPLSADQVPRQFQHEPIIAEQVYLSIFLRSMHIVDVRKGIAKFYGAVHSYISLPHLSGKRAQFHFLTTPAQLKDIDPGHTDRIINVDKRILGPVPYIGGDVEVEIGLFSVKSTELAGPFLSVLEDLTKAAGVSLIDVARPFVDPVLRGVNLLFGTQGDNILEIGLAKTFHELETGYFFIMRATSNDVNPANLRVKEHTNELVNAVTGEPITQFPYMVISIEASQRRETWREITELDEVYKKFTEKRRSGTPDEIKATHAVFIRTVDTCPDLIPPESEELVKFADGLLQKALAYSQTAGEEVEYPELKDIPLYRSVPPEEESE